MVPRAAAAPASTARLLRVLRLAWASPYTLLGLVLGAAWWLGGARPQRVHGVLELALAETGRFPRQGAWRFPFAAITLGHVVLAVDQASLDQWRAHERVHVAQYERWGPLFLPAYLGSSLWQWLCGRDAYWDNRFEVEARRADGC
jgi:hypothetical protein